MSQYNIFWSVCEAATNDSVPEWLSSNLCCYLQVEPLGLSHQNRCILTDLFLSYYRQAFARLLQCLWTIICSSFYSYSCHVRIGSHTPPTAIGRQGRLHCAITDGRRFGLWQNITGAAIWSKCLFNQVRYNHRGRLPRQNGQGMC